MKLIINGNIDFIYYVKSYICNSFKNLSDKDKFIKLNKYLNIDCYKFIMKELRKLKIQKYDNYSYVLRFNNPDRIRFITYGNLQVRGYDIVYKIFKYVVDNIDDIYEEWCNVN